MDILSRSMTLPHPWREIRTLAHVLVHWRSDLGADVRALTDGQRNVWMSKGMTQVQRRCVMAHELIHLRRSHRGCQPPAVEAGVQRDAARWLLPEIEPIGDALAWANCHDEAAEVLWVTSDMLRHRLAALTERERAYLSSRLEA